MNKYFMHVIVSPLACVNGKWRKRLTSSVFPCNVLPFLEIQFLLKMKLTNGAKILGQLIPVTIHLCTYSAGITGIH